MSILLIGSTGNGKSTLGSFLVNPEKEHIFGDNQTFKTAHQATKLKRRRCRVLWDSWWKLARIWRVSLGSDYSPALSTHQVLSNNATSSSCNYRSSELVLSIFFIFHLASTRHLKLAKTDAIIAEDTSWPQQHGRKAHKARRGWRNWWRCHTLPWPSWNWVPRN